VALTALEREMVAAAAQAGRAAALRLIPGYVAGVVTGVDPTNTIATVVADGPNEAHGATIAAPVTLMPGDRVQLLYTGDAARCFVVGRLSGDWDEWHIVGTEGEPPFLTGWGHSAGTLPPGQNGNAQVMFTRRSGRIELRGRATRTSGSATPIFALPEWAWPDNDLLLPCIGAFGANTVCAIEYSTGVVSSAGGADVILDGVSYLARIQQIN
jgi:hypothetical protein